MKNNRLIVIVGPTASGKTDLALEAAKINNGEIICADSRTVYKDMDIGTAKLHEEDRVSVKHHLLDVVWPNEKFNASSFKQLADKFISEISSKGKTPFLVGGSGLYIDSVIYDFDFAYPPDDKKRRELQNLSTDKLRQIIKDKNLTMPKNYKNKRHLIRTIETNGQIPSNKKLRDNTFIIGLDIGKDELRRRIQKRAEIMIEQGLIAETKYLHKKYGSNIEPLNTPAYKAAQKHITGEITLSNVVEEIARGDMALAKRQMTWLKRNDHINWVGSKQKSLELIQANLKKFDTISS